MADPARLDIDDPPLDEQLGAQLDTLVQEGRWEDLIGALLEAASASGDPRERLGFYRRAAAVYEQQLADPEKASITWQAAFSEDYGNQEAAEQLERLAVLQGRGHELVADFEGLLDEIIDGQQKLALAVQLGRWAERLLDAEAAEARYRQALRLQPGNLAAARGLAGLLRARRDFRALAAHLAEAGAAAPRPAERAALLLESAQLHAAELADRPAAAALYAQVLELDPQSAPALEALATMSWEDENWARALPLLEQLAASPGRGAAERSRTYQRAALAALRNGEDERARSHARQVPQLDPGATDFARDWLDVAFSRRWWPDVRSLAEWLQNSPDLVLPDAERAELRFRLGQALLEAEEIEAARAELEQAVSLDPTHRRARERLAQVLGQLGDAAAALEHKKVLVDIVGSTDDRFNMLVDMARSERDQLGNKAAALSAFEEARSVKPSERSILHETLELHSELEQWLPASEILLSLAEDAVPPDRARYLVAAGNILHYQLSDSDAAAELYEKALDDDPSDLKTFERLDKILTARRDFKEQARAYRRMIKRLGSASDEEKRKTLLLLWRGLAEILRTRLGDSAAAVAALEVCTQLDPESLTEQEALAELYEAGGADSWRQAVEKRTLLFDKSAEKGADAATLVRQLKALRSTYAQAGLWDRVYCVCGALTVLQAADQEELAFYERGAAAPVALPAATLTEEIWQKVVYDPGEERRLSLLFSCVAPVVALARAQELKALGLKDRYRLEASSDPSGVARLFETGAGLLSLPSPPIFLNREWNGDAQILNLRDAAGATAAVMVGPNIVNGRVEKDVAFIVGRTLTLLRPDHLLLSPSVVPTEPELEAIVHAAFKLCQPSAPLPNPALYQPYLGLFQTMLPPQALEPLSSLVPWLIESWRSLDLPAWRAAAERTADRAGLLLCGDLGAAVRMLHASRGLSAGPAVLELVRWSVSDAHLGLRELLGMSAAGPT